MIQEMAKDPQYIATARDMTQTEFYLDRFNGIMHRFDALLAELNAKAQFISRDEKPQPEGAAVGTGNEPPPTQLLRTLCETYNRLDNRLDLMQNIVDRIVP